MLPLGRMSALMAVDPGVTTGVAITNNAFAGQKFDKLVKGLGKIRDANRGTGGTKGDGKMQMAWGELPVTTELLPGSFVGWFEIGPSRGWDHEYWTAVLLAELIEYCGVQWLAVEDFILRVGRGSSDRDGLAAVRVTSCFMTILRERKLCAFQGIRGGTECKASQRAGMHLGYRSGARILWQSPSNAKGVMTDDRLRRAGLWIPGKDHARDAMRHLALLWRQVEGKTVKQFDKGMGWSA